MNNVKVNFSIKDLENLSGIKAHTIRIWEKRYNLLTPSRTDTNIRYYSLKSLQKLLNITLLYNNGYKISKIADIPEDELPLVVREIVSENSIKNKSINAFKLAMINFDQTLFLNTYNSLLGDRSFREIFHEVFLPLLNELGLLWQTDTISPAHEHFVTALVKQKILLNIEKLQLSEPTKQDPTFVLFLPDNEIHEIGLLYLNYEIVLRGYRVIYLGQTIPLAPLVDLQRYYDNIVYLSYFTVAPPAEKVHEYIAEFQDIVNKDKNCELWMLGQQVKEAAEAAPQEHVRMFQSIEEVIETL
ncbi:MerR family transcriptional regulator [Robertkochia sediminum]|uniref:MerR family transcriptional regulator n=1 Tax=Robertkochia sediminum TaxID=2785326 RepID=UPI001934AA9F|nr:MerR family transcriptional regulator [Robertkochia sediminum]MBL7472519.1 MerR family transcriptional regulator [Robertkochia sediminum]